jgi:multicomponent Na+:H+ antiporter subunit B
MKKPLWYEKLERWVEGDGPTLKEPAAHVEGKNPSAETPPAGNLGPSLLRGSGASVLSWLTRVFAIACCLVFALLMIATVAYLPRFGGEDVPAENETVRRYIEKGLEEVGATNLVTNIILVYRGFDTYGESCVLFLGATAVIMLLEADSKNTSEEDEKELELSDMLDNRARNQILGHIATILMPVVMLYGLYILCNGHLSPGGGFAGGSILGGALILCENAFGVSRVRSFFNHRIYHIIKVGALILYAVLICYTIYVGANGLPNIIPLGKPGSILSAGIILPINIAVGLEVACTMYAFYTYFGRGEL